MAQLCKQIPFGSCGRNDQRGDAFDISRGTAIQLKHDGIQNAVQALQSSCQIRQRCPLARDFQQVGIAPAKPESSLRSRFEKILHHDAPPGDYELTVSVVGRPLTRGSLHVGDSPVQLRCLPAEGGGLRCDGAGGPVELRP